MPHIAVASHRTATPSPGEKRQWKWRRRLATTPSTERGRDGRLLVDAVVLFVFLLVFTVKSTPVRRTPTLPEPGQVAMQVHALGRKGGGANTVLIFLGPLLLRRSPPPLIDRSTVRTVADSLSDRCRLVVVATTVRVATFAYLCERERRRDRTGLWLLWRSRSCSRTGDRR